ncbi:MAG: hypothetical protein GX455_09480 [Phycisphaerae bacterium]|nr:hypothetical protein [Phycisphaerae bacterium]
MIEDRMFGWFRRRKRIEFDWKIRGFVVDLYPSNRSCVKKDMRHVRPQQLPPLMVRKAAWRR